ncbi:MAG: hypothetical protein KDD50_00355 [Bdellovibrionales bacterium]|nr:hypothetical protein [Bdellovibrionales bacterium]
MGFLEKSSLYDIRSSFRDSIRRVIKRGFLVLVYCSGYLGVLPQGQTEALVSREILGGLSTGKSIVLEGTLKQRERLRRWIQQINLVPIGEETLSAIDSSNHQVLVRHSVDRLIVAGATLAPLSFNLTNGVGVDVEILFDCRIPDSGSHIVEGTDGRWIEFTAVENLFHELSHARHKATGNWRSFDSEGQAIEDENIFRQQMASMKGIAPVALRGSTEGEQIWFPDSIDLAMANQ